MNRTYSKSELAELAGVSYSTFNRYLRSRRKILNKLGSKLKAKTLRGKALEYICEDYNITLPEEQPPTKHLPFR
jgi:transcriptional regulator with XRE-family HTH domain